MTAVDVIKILGEMGLKFRGENELDKAIEYFVNMINDERVIVVSEDGKPYAVIAYSMTNDYEKFLKKGTWDYLHHDPNGKTIYVEKLASKGWNKQIRTIFEHIIGTKYPNMEYGVWHRYGKTGDRKVITKRRIVCTK